MRTLSDIDYALDRCGERLPEDHWLTVRARQQALEKESKFIADAMERCGVPAYDRKAALRVLVDLILGQVKELTNFRHIQVLPAVQAATCRQTARRLEFFLKKLHRKTPVFMFVFSGGLIPIRKIKRTQADLTRRLSRAAPILKKRWDVDLIWRAAEHVYQHACDLTTRDPLFHSHLHSVAIRRRWLTEKEFEAMNAFLRSIMPKKYCHCSRLVKIEEVTKYVTKPADLLSLSDVHIAQFATEMRGTRPRQAMGTFRKFCRWLDKRHLKVVARKTRKYTHWFYVRRGNGQAKYGVAAPAPSDIVLSVFPAAPFTNTIHPCAIVCFYSGIDSLRKRLPWLQSVLEGGGGEAPVYAAHIDPNCPSSPPKPGQKATDSKDALYSVPGGRPAGGPELPAESPPGGRQPPVEPRLSNFVSALAGT